MSVARHHADWLNLVEANGPFVSLPVLMRTFPQGLEPRDPQQAKLLRDVYEQWQENPSAPGVHRAWVLHVLTNVLGYPENQLTEGQSLPAGLEARMAEMGETLRPDIALVGPAGSDTAGKAHLLIVSYPDGQALDKPVIGKHWKATPATRMMELLHGANVSLGLITNGEQWMLVYAPPKETTGYASWYASLWMDEPITLRAFHSLLGVRRFFGVAADSTLLGLLNASAQDQQEVTDQLGYQVREAVEVLVQSFDVLDKDSNRQLLKGVNEQELYNSALTIMMRLVFLFSAEERKLLHLGKPLYDENYAVSTLQEHLQEVADRYGEEVLERRYDAWARLLATFRAVHGGIHHQDLLMPAYGGSLFDPDKYPFLEGRAGDTRWRETTADPLAVNNRVVLHLLNALQRLRVKVPGGGPAESRRISFSALGVEQIGHVYEGLLDHTAVRASEPVLGIKGTRDKEPEIPLAKLESRLAQGQDKLIEFLKEETGRSVSALRKALNGESLLDDHKLLIACGHDEKLVERLRPFAGIIREDSFERPVVVLAGSVYVTAGSERRSTGTHYTPPSLTEPIVRHTLEPLVYIGPAEGLPKEEWQLKSPKDILGLKVCDMAMGSGAFLVQACRYLAERLVEAWENEEKKHPGQVLITPDGEFSHGSPSERLVPKDAAERVAIAMRYVADRCLYGVDINPMAVEMAKLSLWLITVQRDRPFTFLDHALKCGDSLLGVSSVKQIENFSLRPGEQQFTFETANLFRYVDEASAKRRALEELPSNDSIQIEAKIALHAEAEAATAKVKAIADCLIAFELRGLDGRAYEEQRALEAAKVQALLTQDADASHQSPSSNQQSVLAAAARDALRGRHPFQWALEFPEVFARGGFDAFVGNPPFVGGKRISATFGDEYAEALSSFYPPATRNVDLCGFFHMRGCALLDIPGFYGFISTERVLVGDTKTSCLNFLAERHGHFYQVVECLPWPGDASVTIAILYFSKRATLSEPTQEEAAPFMSLLANDERSFVGCAIQGLGFVLEAGEAVAAEEHGETEVVRHFLISDDLNNQVGSIPKRRIIFFGGMSLQDAQAFPFCLGIVEKRVKPYRETVKRKAHRISWWQYGDRRPGLYSAISKLNRVLVVGLTSKHLAFEFVPTDYVYDQTTVVVASSSDGDFAVLSSSLHQHWALSFGANLGGTPRYNPSRCFVPFPFPRYVSSLCRLGESVYSLRREIVQIRQEGLTKTYNRFHDRGEKSEDIVRLRALYVEMDQAVAAAYGWNDLELGHGFHETKQGVRYTISEPARRKVLDRLLALNHERYAEEVKAGLHDKGAKKKAKRIKSPSTSEQDSSGSQDELFG